MLECSPRKWSPYAQESRTQPKRPLSFSAYREWRFQPGGVIEYLRKQEKQASIARDAAAQRLAAALDYSEQRDKFRNAQQAVGKLTQ